jgi:hypothetical protein
MDWTESIDAALPSPDGNEPPSLRRDITDELADHLATALKRELCGAADEQAARQAVIARFGDPTEVARKLWFDGMKGKLMAQRITLVAALLLVAVCGATGFFAWQSFQQGRDMNLALLEEA